MPPSLGDITVTARQIGIEGIGFDEHVPITVSAETIARMSIVNFVERLNVRDDAILPINMGNVELN